MPYVSGGVTASAAISGVTVSGAAVAGDVPVATSASAGSWVFPPGHEFGYDQITANVTISSATEATGTTVITCAAHVFDGGLVLAEFYSPGISPANADDIQVSLFEGATQITRLAFVQAQSATSGAPFVPTFANFRFTPTAASHTYTVTAIKGTTNGTIAAGLAGTGAFAPCYIRFVKV
jgi:hypothetical protein